LARINLFQFNRKRVILLSFILLWGEEAMIALLGASAITLTALQGVINAPRDAFRACLRAASEKAETEKVGGEAIEAYLRNACSGQASSLKSAVIAFNMKNGMARGTAAADASSTVDNYLAPKIDNYKYMAELNAPAKPAPANPANPATPAPTQASVSTQPPKP
jgi:hypothetical protein